MPCNYHLAWAIGLNYRKPRVDRSGLLHCTALVSGEKRLRGQHLVEQLVEAPDVAGQFRHHSRARSFLTRLAGLPRLPAIVVVGGANVPKAASKFSSFLEKQSVSRLSRFMKTRCVPFNRSTWLVHIVQSDRPSIPRTPSRFVPTISDGV
jgi:hypothetical protein